MRSRRRRRLTVPDHDLHAALVAPRVERERIGISHARTDAGLGACTEVDRIDDRSARLEGEPRPAVAATHDARLEHAERVVEDGLRESLSPRPAPRQRIGELEGRIRAGQLTVRLALDVVAGTPALPHDLRVE